MKEHNQNETIKRASKTREVQTILHLAPLDGSEKPFPPFSDIGAYPPPPTSATPHKALSRYVLINNTKYAKRT